MEAVRKLRARLVIQNESFAAEMASQGHLVELSDEAAGSPGGPGFQDTHHPRRMTRADFIRRHVEPLLDASPGLELRMDKNPLLVYTLFRNYSQNWPDIASRHLEEVQAICNDFLQEVVDFAWPIDMRPRAWNAFVEEKMEGRMKEASTEASKLFKDRTRAAKPYDPEHTSKVLEWLAKRNQNTSGSNLLSEFAPDVFLQKMLVYYELTCKTFVSNVIVQVVERHLVDELDRIFNVMRLAEFDDSEILEIAAEDPGVREQRIELRNTRRVLEAGERICRKYTARRDLSLDTAAPTSIKGPSSRPYNPNGNATPKKNQNRKPLAPAQPDTTAQRPSFEETSPRQASYRPEQNVQRSASRATTATADTQATASISNPGDPYAPVGYHSPRESYTPSYTRNESANGYYDAAPSVPPRPPPSLPPKRPENGQENGVISGDAADHSRRGQASVIRGMFAGRKQ